jgi:hypothetical protein
MTEQPLPEQTFFADPVVDRVLGVAMTLATEVWVLRDRVRALESILVASGQLQSGALDGYAPRPEEAEAIARDRDAFVASLMTNLLGREVSKSATAEQVEAFVGKH